MNFKKLLVALALVAAFARPAEAQFVSFREASIGYGEGNRNGVVALDLAANSEVQTDGSTMTFDAATGRWVGFGKIDYEGNGVSVHESRAAFSIRVEPVPADLEVFCGPSPVPNPSYAAHIEARNAKGNLILVAGLARNIADPGRCPYWHLSANVGQNLPATLALMLPKYRDGAAGARATKPGYSRTVSGRLIKQ